MSKLTINSNENRKPYVGGMASLAVGDFQMELQGMEFKIRCLRQRQHDLQRGIEVNQVLGLSFDDYCELQAAIAVGQAVYGADRHWRWDNRD